MIYFLSKLVGFLTAPYLLAFVGGAIGFLLVLFNKKRWAKIILGLTLLWMYLLAIPVLTVFLIVPLERNYPNHLVEQLPEADLIHVLGGGMSTGGVTNALRKVEGDWLCDCRESADRVWHGARLWKAGKAPKLLITGPECSFSSLPFLVDLGVDTNAVIVAESPRTTEEEAKWVEGEMGLERRSVKVLVVTTAIHMRRAMMLYQRFAPHVEAIPAATDYMELPYEGFREFHWQGFVPSSEAMSRNNQVLHEYIGYWGRKLLRRK